MFIINVEYRSAGSKAFYFSVLTATPDVQYCNKINDENTATLATFLGYSSEKRFLRDRLKGAIL